MQFFNNLKIEKYLVLRSPPKRNHEIKDSLFCLRFDKILLDLFWKQPPFWQWLTLDVTMPPHTPFYRQPMLYNDGLYHRGSLHTLESRRMAKKKWINTKKGASYGLYSVRTLCSDARPPESDYSKIPGDARTKTSQYTQQPTSSVPSWKRSTMHMRVPSSDFGVSYTVRRTLLRWCQ